MQKNTFAIVCAVFISVLKAVNSSFRDFPYFDLLKPTYQDSSGKYGKYYKERGGKSRFMELIKLVQ